MLFFHGTSFLPQVLKFDGCHRLSYASRNRSQLYVYGHVIQEATDSLNDKTVDDLRKLGCGGGSKSPAPVTRTYGRGEWAPQGGPSCLLHHLKIRRPGYYC